MKTSAFASATPRATIPARLTAAAALLCSVFMSSAAAGDEGRVSYNRDVRPILSDNCFYCHGPDKSHRKAKLRLDVREAAVRQEAIVPGQPDESLLVARIFTDDPDDLMPPPESHKKLTTEQKELLKRWVKEGAEYEPHWAYITPKRPDVPRAANPKYAGWARNPVDGFILKPLEAKGVAPSKEADRRTLLRRLSLDLTGLPPTPAEVEAFVNDKSPDAYEKQVDRLLASPHYGERMAAPWLDAVRFADTVGYHGDQNQNVFPYRDYVINAFHTNKPFDRFTVEQLAGDLLPNPTTEQLVATGFNRLNMMTREGGAQPKEYLAKYAADRVRTVGNTWLGSTFGCAECHDHKFDPITAKDFYSLAAYWADVRQWGVYNDYTYTPNPDLKGWSNDHPFPPEIVVDSPYLAKRQARLMGRIDETLAAAGERLKQDAKRREAFARWRQSTAEFLRRHPDGWAAAAPVGLEDEKAVKKGADGKYAAQGGTVLFTGKVRDKEQVEFAPDPGTVAALRVELLPHARHAGNVARGPAANVQIAASIKAKAGGKETKLPVFFADADHKDDRYANGYLILGVTDLWRASTKHPKSPQSAVYVLAAPAVVSDGDRLVISFAKDSAGSVRVSTSPIAPLKPVEPALAELLQKALDGPPDALVQRTYLLSTGWDAAALGEVRRLFREVLECRDGKSPTLVTAAQKPMATRILPRGNWQDESGEVVEPASPHFLPALPKSDSLSGGRQTRLDLARWIVSPENPLTGRVVVNRLWKQFFGAGLCNSVEDLGAQGEPPSHPELLDWLAVEFREKGWHVKHVVRLMVTSSTYRQDSNLRPELKEADPANRLLASQNPRRLEAEFVRDNALFAAGLLNVDDVGGPSVKPYQPADYYENLQFPSRVYAPDPDERQWRRGVYMHWQRTFLHPMLANFDAPSREDSTCTRIVSNTPQQALTLLNDPTFVEAARVLAQRVLASAPAADDAGRLEAIYQRALGRAPKSKERDSLAAFLAAQRDYYRANPHDAEKLIRVGVAPIQGTTDPAELAAWATVCRVVLNLHETVTRY